MTSTGAASTTEIRFNRPDPQKAYSALHKLDFSLTPVPDGSVFTLEFPVAQATFGRSIGGAPADLSFWLALNTHLLPNGPNRVELRLEDPNGNLLTSDSFEINILNAGSLAEQVRDSLRARQSPVVFEDVVDSRSFDTENTALLPWYDRPDPETHIKGLLDQKRISLEEADDLRRLVSDGYVQLSQKIEPDLISAANAAMDDAIGKRYQNYEFGTSQRIEHLHEHYQAMNDLWKHPLVLRYLSLIFDVEPLPCQTLTYVFGSEQDLHQDTIHLTSFPSGYMCGVWIALEDIQANSGELMVAPGSHRLERIYRKSVDCPVVKDGDWSVFGNLVGARWAQMSRDNAAEPLIYRPQAGTILIWLDSLLHGGSKRVDKTLTRRSVVSHYFAAGSIAYYDSTGLPGHVHR